MGLTIKANPNSTNSEFDAKTIVYPDHASQFEYEKEQHRRACSMEHDYVEPT